MNIICDFVLFLQINQVLSNINRNEAGAGKNKESVRMFRNNNGPEAEMIGVETLEDRIKSNIRTDRSNTCLKINSALRKKDLIISKLEKVKSITITEAAKAKHDSSSKEITTGQIEIVELFQKQLDMNEALLYSTIDWLDHLLAGKYSDISFMKMHMENRLKNFRDAAFREEQDYHSLIEAEKRFNRTRYPNGELTGVVGQILQEISLAADNLENDLDRHLFAVAANRTGDGPSIETLVRLGAGDEALQRLVDSNDNQYVLSKAQDSTTPHEDISFIMDIVSVTSLSAVFSYICWVINIPIMFGQVICGVILGPTVLNFLKSPVQLETLAELGVSFIMFSVGLEFSPFHIQKVLVISCLGSFGLMAFMILAGFLVSFAVPASSLPEAAFIAACFSLSSTPLVVKLLANHNPPSMTLDDCSGDTNSPVYADILLGILVLQDILMGLLLAILPALSGNSKHGGYSTAVYQVSFALIIILAVCLFLIYILQKVRFSLLRLSPELLTLASVTFLFVVMLITFQTGLSMEFGCFLAGSIISSVGKPLTSKIELYTNPIKDLFSCLFFAALGFHIFPKFVLVELGTLMVATALVVTFKFTAGLFLMRVFLPQTVKHNSWIVAAGLSQVSEFSFVLSSRARYLGLISREVYLLIVSISTLSLLISPVLWMSVAITDRPKRISRSCSRDPQQSIQ